MYIRQGVHIGATWRIALNRPRVAAMLPYVKLLWPTCFSKATYQPILRIFDMWNSSGIQHKQNVNFSMSPLNRGQFYLKIRFIVDRWLFTAALSCNTHENDPIYTCRSRHQRLVRVRLTFSKYVTVSVPVWKLGRNDIIVAEPCAKKSATGTVQMRCWCTQDCCQSSAALLKTCSVSSKTM